MANVAEAILVCAWRFLHFSMKTSSVCVQKHPFVSAILLFFYIFYVFFNLFVVWFPFLVCIAVLLRVFWTSGGLTILEVERDEKRNDHRMPCQKPEPTWDDRVVANQDGCSLTKQKSRRTNVATRCGVVEDAQANEEEEGRSMSTASNDNLIGGSGNALLGKNTKLIMEEKKNCSSVHGETSAARASADENIQLLVEQRHSIVDADLSDSHLLSSDDSDGQTEKFERGVNGEAVQKGGNNKVVQWTDDDQKNLMDLGLSEIERNKRLESLIARRRIRKLFKMQVEKGLVKLDTVIPGHIAPIFIARNNPLEFVKGSNEMDTPGSAPSILLPTQNPFDLPYDPLEEKPNLMADSFQQEFARANQKEMIFCRHESFSLGPSFSSEAKKKAMDGKGYSRFKKLSSAPVEETGAHDKYIERMSSGKHDDVIEALLSKVRHTISDLNNNGDISENGIESPIQATNSVKLTDEENKETQSVIDMKGMNNTERGTWHTPTYYISSDLQAEVSEPGSPPLTVDGANSPTDRESLTLDGDFENEYMWGVSSQSSRAEENEPRSREFRGLSEKDLAEIRLSGNIKSNKDVVESSMHLQQPDELDDVCSLSSSITEICGDSQSNSMSFDGKTYDDVRQVGEEVRNPRASSSSNIALSPGNQEETMKMAEKLVSVNSEKSPSSPDETTKKVNVPAANAIDNSKDEKKNIDKDSGAETLSTQEAVKELPKPNVGTILESSRNSKRSTVNPAEHQATVDTIHPIKDDKNSNHIGGGLQKVTENEGNKERNPKTNLNTLVQGSKDEQGTAEWGVSEVKQISGDPIASATQKDLINEYVRINSTSSSSPKSVLLEDIPKDQVSSSNSNPDKHIGAPKPKVGDKVTNNSSTEKPHDSTLLPPQNGIHSADESTSHRSNTSDSKEPQEPCKPPEKSTEEANIIQKKPDEEIGNLSQKAIGAASKLNKQANEIEKVSQNSTEAAAELKKSVEDIGSASHKATEVVAEMKRQQKLLQN